MSICNCTGACRTGLGCHLENSRYPYNVTFGPAPMIHYKEPKQRPKRYRHKYNADDYDGTLAMASPPPRERADR